MLVKFRSSFISTIEPIFRPAHTALPVPIASGRGENFVFGEVSKFPVNSFIIADFIQYNLYPVKDNEDISKHEKFVLVLITGGTLCMKRNEKGNYAPVEGFLEDTLPGISLLHDRNGHFTNLILGII